MKKLAVVMFCLLAAIALLAAGAFYAAKVVLAPLPGEWSLLLRLGPLQLDAGVPSLIRLGTSVWGGPLLDGRSFNTSSGRVHLTWQTPTRTLLLRCAPCTLQAPGMGQQPLQLPQLQASARRLGEYLSGELSSGQVRGTWKGELAGGKLRLQLVIEPTPLADGYALFAAQVPELAQARIAGQFSLRAHLSLPSGTLTVSPRIDGFEVAGLGTESLAGARSSCTEGKRASRLTPESWLARAVIAAEDQRFHEHTGYDLAELSLSLTRNHEADRIERGASTLTQQLVKLLITGDERSAARKLREMLYAVEMERTLGKARILRLYLDNAPWGARLCGAEAAARHYFGVRAHELSPAQAAWLAAMLHDPVAEAQRWADSGQINLARAQRVALALRGMSRKQKLALAEEMAAMDWRPSWAEPVTQETPRINHAVDPRAPRAAAGAPTPPTLTGRSNSRPRPACAAQVLSRPQVLSPLRGWVSGGTSARLEFKRSTALPLALLPKRRCCLQSGWRRVAAYSVKLPAPRWRNSSTSACRASVRSASVLAFIVARSTPLPTERTPVRCADLRNASSRWARTRDFSRMTAPALLRSSAGAGPMSLITGGGIVVVGASGRSGAVWASTQPAPKAAAKTAIRIGEGMFMGAPSPGFPSMVRLPGCCKGPIPRLLR